LGKPLSQASVVLNSNGFISPRDPLCKLMPMCLAIPAKVLDVKKSLAEVDFGNGVFREVNIALVDVKVGDYILVHAGYAIQVLDEAEALETLRLWDELLKVEPEQDS